MNPIESARSALRLALSRLSGCRVDPESLELRYNAVVELRGPGGQLKARREVHNLVVAAGKAKLLDASAPEYVKDFKYMAIGTGSVSPSSGDTALGAEVARSTAIAPTNPVSGQLAFAGTFGAGVGTGTITECGMLDAASVGTMLNRLTFAGVPKGAADSLTITITFS